MKTLIEIIVTICLFIGGLLLNNIDTDVNPIGAELVSAIELYNSETMLPEQTMSFKSIATTFDSVEIYTDFRNDTEMYSVEGFSIIDDEWVIDVIYKQYDTESLAKAYWNENVGTSKFHLETYASPNGETINGHENDTVSYWFVDGYIYQTLYSCIDGYTVFEIYAQASTETISKADGLRMQATVEKVLGAYRYDY